MTMRKPAREDMDRVLELARAMRDKGKDQYKLAYVLLYLVERNAELEDLRNKAEYYIRFGMGETELTALRQALAHLREMDVEEADASSLFARE